MTPLKWLERRLRRVWRPLAARLLLGRGRSEPPDWRARPYRLLILRYDRIGDMMMTTPLIRAIAHAHPSFTIDVVASTANASVLRGNPHLRRIYAIDAKRWWPILRIAPALRRTRYDAVIDAISPWQRYRPALLLMAAARAPYRIAIGGGGYDYLYSLLLPAMPETVHFSDRFGAIARLLGVDTDGVDWRPTFELDERARAGADAAWAGVAGNGTRLLVNIPSADRNRRWDDAHFGAVVRHLRARLPDARIIVVGMPDERELVERVASAGGAMAATPDLWGAVGLVATADLLVTPDTSLSHAASAFRTPAVVLHYQHAWMFVPFGIPRRSVFSDSSSLATLPPEPVIAAVDELLEELGLAAAPGPRQRPLQPSPLGSP